jgi:hypothetical protein
MGLGWALGCSRIGGGAGGREEAGGRTADASAGVTAKEGDFAAGQDGSRGGKLSDGEHGSAAIVLLKKQTGDDKHLGGPVRQVKAPHAHTACIRLC